MSPQRPGSVEKMVATRRERDNYKHSPDYVEKMLSTKRSRGKMNSNTPETKKKCKETKIKNGTWAKKHSLETLEKLKSRSRSDLYKAIVVAKCLETKRLNGTMNSNTPETIAKRKETLLAKWGTVNTREISKLKLLKEN